MHRYIRATHFSPFIPLSLRPPTPAVLLWIWYFLIPTCSRLPALLYTISPLISNCQILFRPLISSHVTSAYIRSPFHVPSRRSYVNLVLILTLFIFHTFPFWKLFFHFLLHRFIAPRLHAPFSIIIFSSTFFPLRLLSHDLYCTFSQLPQSPRYTPQLARARWIFILCVSYLHTTGLGLKRLKCIVLGRFKHMHSD